MLSLVELLSGFVGSVPCEGGRSRPHSRVESLSCGIGDEGSTLRGIFWGLSPDPSIPSSST